MAEKPCQKIVPPYMMGLRGFLYLAVGRCESFKGNFLLQMCDVRDGHMRYWPFEQDLVSQRIDLYRISRSPKDHPWKCRAIFIQYRKQNGRSLHRQRDDEREPLQEESKIDAIAEGNNLLIKR